MDKKNFKPNATGSQDMISKPNKLSTAAEATTMVNRNATLPQSIRQVFQTFILVWLDVDFDESKDDYKKPRQHLRDMLAIVTTFTDVDEYMGFLTDIHDEKVSMIVSGTLAQHLIPEIQECPQLTSIYVLCDSQSTHEKWVKTIPKVKGVYTQIEPICDALQIDRRNCDQDMISMSFNRIDPLFMYTQFLKETLLDIEDDDAKSIKELAEYCRLESNASEQTLESPPPQHR
ncbi:unnamed protein product, partial [Rotaria sp. Silwood2]